MKTEILDRIAILVTGIGIVAVIAFPFVYEADVHEELLDANARVVTITGFADSGLWVEGEVRAGNYFARTFESARPVLRVGETTLLRLKSADVVHVFYSPELGIGPVEVYPGHVAEIEVTPTAAGAFDYYCERVCGRPHFRMRGQFVVRPAVGTPEVPGEYWEEPPPDSTRLVDHGGWLFRTNGCFSCHGTDGHGGVDNPNYVSGEVPALDTLSQRMFLYYPEDVEAIVAVLEQRTPLETLADNPPVPGFSRVLAQYRSVKELLKKGNEAGRKDDHGPQPPLQMPSWESRLSEADIDALVAYMLSLGPEAR